jgi:cyclohexanone monooxygenase
MKDAVIIGAGLAGMCMLHRLREMGMTAQVYETGSDVGGTWYWNRYPGARCDVESLDYQFAFSDELQRGWTWTERYAPQSELLDYARYVADSLDLRRDIQFETRVESARFDESDGLWRITTDSNDSITAKFCISAVGCLAAAPRVPQFAGLDSFQGPWYHTGNWPKEQVDFSGQRVGLIGTGSSGIQCIPEIAAEAKQLLVFQRTPNFSVPAHNARLSPEDVDKYKDTFLALRREATQSDFGNSTWTSLPSALAATPEEREAAYERSWEIGGAQFMVAFEDMLTDAQANATAADFVRRKIRSIVKDPEVAEKLSPTDHPLGAKRLCVDTNYYATFNRDNVQLIDVRSAPIEAITATGLRTTDAEYEFDALVFATGFDAMTGPLTRIDIRGRDGLSLRDKWAAGPRTYLGLTVAGFPNFFTITGPGSPSVLSNMALSIEQHVEWIGDCIAWLREQDQQTIEAKASAEDGWVDHVNEVANTTLFPQANSWYMGANVPGKTRVFMPYVGGVGTYRRECDAIAADGYAGFTVEPPQLQNQTN